MTATHDTPRTGHGNPGVTHRPEPIDPERDIDAKSTAIWVLGSTAVLFVSLYLMLIVFDRVLGRERGQKIDELPALELEEVLAAERAFLSGEQSPSGKSIEQVMREMAGR